MSSIAAFLSSANLEKSSPLSYAAHNFLLASTYLSTASARPLYEDVNLAFSLSIFSADCALLIHGYPLLFPGELLPSPDTVENC